MQGIKQSSHTEYPSQDMNKNLFLRLSIALLVAVLMHIAPSDAIRGQDRINLPFTEGDDCSILVFVDVILDDVRSGPEGVSAGVTVSASSFR